MYNYEFNFFLPEFELNHTLVLLKLVSGICCKWGPWYCLDARGKYFYPKENDLPLSFAPTNICPLGCLDGVVNVDVDEREGERNPPQICSNLLPLGKWNWRVKTFAPPHLPHMFGTLEVN
jgi:hypothetical protein